MDLQQHLKRQIAFSRATYGPPTTTKGVINHIRKELIEVEEAAASTGIASKSEMNEWADVVILALDGMWRSMEMTGLRPDGVPDFLVGMIEEKQLKNELREWPDYRTADPDKAIEHIK